MAVTITYSGTIEKFQQAFAQANEIMGSEDFFTLIASRSTPFKELKPKDLSPQIISELFRASTLSLNLKEYKRQPSVGGAFDPDFPSDIYGNVNALHRSVCSLAAMLVHECVHALNFHTKEYNFSHDSDPPNLNQDTAPYWIQGQLREMYCDASFTEDKDYIVVELNIDSGKE